MNDQRVQIIIELLKQGEGGQVAARDLMALEAQARKTDERVGQLGDTLKKVAAAVATSLVVKSSVQAFAEQEQAIAKANGVLKASGQFSRAYAQELQDLATGLQAVTTFGDETVLAVSSQLVAFGAARQDVPKLTEVVLDLAAGMGTDASSAAMLMGKALAGEFSTLSRYGILVDEGASQSEKLSQAIRQIEARFGGMARALAQTDAGRLIQLKNALGEVQEQLGRVIVKGLGPLIAETGKAAKSLEGMLAKSELAPHLVSEIILVTGAIVGLNVVLAASMRLWVSWGVAAGAAVGGLMGALAAIPKSLQITFIAVGLYEIISAAKELNGLMGALANEKVAEHRAVKVMEKERALLTNEINKREMAGVLSQDQASKLRAQLLFGFTPRGRVERGAMDGDLVHRGGVRPDVLVPEVDAARAHAGLKGVRSSLFPEVFPTEPKKAGVETREDREEQKKAMEERRDAIQEIEQLQEQLYASSLEGIERERAAADAAFNQRAAQIEDLSKKAQLSSGDRERLETLNVAVWETEIAQAEAKKREQIRREEKQRQEELWQEANERIRTLEDDLTLAALRGSETRTEQAEREYEARVDFYRKLADEGKLTEDKLTELTRDAKFEREKMIAEEQRHQREKTKTLSQDMQAIGDQARYQFASGLASAFVAMASGSKSAGEAFKEFAAMFMQQVAQMIMQMLILRALQSAFGSVSGSIGGGGVMGGFPASSGVVAVAAGGLLGPAGVKYAAQGLMAGGMPGLGEVDRATYFPNFNAVAGEAGREVLAVLARPARLDVDGIKAMIGNVGPHRMAVLSADGLARLRQGAARKMAAGGMVVADTGSFASSGGGGGGGGGRQVIEIGLEPGLKAQIVEQSVDAAEVRINTKLNQDSPTSRAVKRIVN